MCKANLQAGIPTSVSREAAPGMPWGAVMQQDINPAKERWPWNHLQKQSHPVDETLLSGDGQGSFCSENSIVWCWFQVKQRHLLLWSVTRARREPLVTFQPHAKVAYSKRSLGCLLMVEKCWWHKGSQKSAGSSTWIPWVKGINKELCSISLQCNPNVLHEERHTGDTGCGWSVWGRSWWRSHREQSRTAGNIRSYLVRSTEGQAGRPKWKGFYANVGRVECKMEGLMA